MIDLMTIAHRAQSSLSAVEAFEDERRQFGSAFSFDPLRGREIHLTAVTEACSLISIWLGQTPAGNAAAVAASALRSAFWLWLEDDDRAMALLRIVLEQTARMRAWRIKPEASRRLEESLKTTPRDWLEAAGLRRLSALNRAVGELAHARISSRWIGARNLIIELQPHSHPDKPNEQTGRGMALQGVTLLLAREVALTAEMHSSVIGDAFREALQPEAFNGTSTDRAIEDWIDHIWSHRSSSLGESSFVGPASDRLKKKEA
jgi:hypothetical protein